MKEQNKILTSLGDRITKKDEEIEQLHKMVKRYKKYFDDFELIKATLAQRNKQFDRLVQENQILFSEVNKVAAENKDLHDKILSHDKAKYEYVK